MDNTNTVTIPLDKYDTLLLKSFAHELMQKMIDELNTRVENLEQQIKNDSILLEGYRTKKLPINCEVKSKILLEGKTLIEAHKEVTQELIDKEVKEKLIPAYDKPVKVIPAGEDDYNKTLHKAELKVRSVEVPKEKRKIKTWGAAIPTKFTCTKKDGTIFTYLVVNNPAGFMLQIINNKNDDKKNAQLNSSDPYKIKKEIETIIYNRIQWGGDINVEETKELEYFTARIKDFA